MKTIKSLLILALSLVAAYGLYSYYAMQSNTPVPEIDETRIIRLPEGTELGSFNIADGSYSARESAFNRLLWQKDDRDSIKLNGSTDTLEIFYIKTKYREGSPPEKSRVILYKIIQKH